jgi:hypothetical protein
MCAISIFNHYYMPFLTHLIEWHSSQIMHFNFQYNKILLKMLHCHVNYFHIYVNMIEINLRSQWHLSFLWMCGGELSSTYCGISSLNMLQDPFTYGKVCYSSSLLVVVRSCIKASTFQLYTSTWRVICIIL